MIIGIRCTSSIIRIHAIISIETRVCGAFVRETEVSTKVQDRERVIRALGNDVGYIDPEESTTDGGSDELFSQEREIDCLQCCRT